MWRNPSPRVPLHRNVILIWKWYDELSPNLTATTYMAPLTTQERGRGPPLRVVRLLDAYTTRLPTGVRATVAMPILMSAMLRTGIL